MISTVPDIDTDPLVYTLHKLSGGRVLSESIRDKEQDMHILQIPVVEPNPGDKTDAILRKFSRDWIRDRLEKVSVESKYEPLPPGTSYYLTSGKEVPVQGKITICWWGRRQKTDMEELKDQQKKWKGTRPVSEKG
jgi:hypothetical protein